MFLKKAESPIKIHLQLKCKTCKLVDWSAGWSLTALSSEIDDTVP